MIASTGAVVLAGLSGVLLWRASPPLPARERVELQAPEVAPQAHLTVTPPEADVAPPMEPLARAERPPARAQPRPKGSGRSRRSQARQAAPAREGEVLHDGAAHDDVRQRPALVQTPHEAQELAPLMPSAAPQRLAPPAADQAAVERPSIALAPPRPRAHEAAPPSHSLDEEVLLMRKAYDFLRGGEPQRAQSALAEHARCFPEGRLALMREVARMLALCALGQESLARDKAARFLAEHPRSTYAPRVRRICEGTP